MAKVSAVVYPVPIGLIDRLLVENRYIFVKYLARTTNTRLQQGCKILFYASKAHKRL